MDGADAIQAGFANAFIPRADLAGLVARLSDGTSGVIEDIMEEASDRPVPASKLAASRDLITRIFAHETIEEMQVEALGTTDPLARRVATDLASKSPKALKLALVHEHARG